LRRQAIWPPKGKLQGEIASELGVSIMTLYRWRKTLADPDRPLVPDETTLFVQELGASQHIADLQLENARLRRLVTDLLLEKMVVEEDSQRRKVSASSI
jgi:transposase-like protein